MTRFNGDPDGVVAAGEAEAAIGRRGGEGFRVILGVARIDVAEDDIIIIMSYALMDFEEAKTFKPWLVFPNETDNSLT